MIDYAKTYFDENGRLIAETYDDVYFSIEGGLAETHYVFIEGNDLKQNIGQHTPFTIIETGFGTGLNFMATWDWLTQQNITTPLHFISVEKHPLTEYVFAQSLAEYPSIKPYQQHILKHYSKLTSQTINTVQLTPQITLTLLIGDVAEVLKQSPQKANAWYLDGFSPSKNPQMWQQSLFDNMAKLSHPHATFATFTAAGMVRKGLAQAGFTVEKIKGFGHKRHMTKGILA
ncbi:MAG: hypothetical protein CMF60_08845 [Magnetococcales bacterium]|nr:hypothetical protein [Magnetococcales bacterium]|tara:strand:+ start:12720 stop:13409 length:690 start_codon:yes stop_codon:yes gene_type:complete